MALDIPSVDIMMLSVAECFRSLAMGVIMTGMGADGALGMEAIFREGGLTVGRMSPPALSTACLDHAQKWAF